jgi:hypothetical protein
MNGRGTELAMLFGDWKEYDLAVDRIDEVIECVRKQLNLFYSLDPGLRDHSDALIKRLHDAQTKILKEWSREATIDLMAEQAQRAAEAKAGA